MQRISFRGYEALIFEGYDGNSMYVLDAQGVQVYAHKYSGDAMSHLIFIVTRGF